MKLNYKRTLLAGLAFFTICAFWPLYEATVPLMLKNTFHMGDTLSGLIMAMDNILALVLLPYFGMLSDRSRSRFGRRMPFIVVGTLLSCLFMVLLPAADQLANLPMFLSLLFLLLLSLGLYRSPAVALMPDITPKPLRSQGNAMINLMGALGAVVTLGLVSLMVHEQEGVRTNYQIIFCVIAFCMLLALAVMLLTVREKQFVSEAQSGITEEEEAGEKTEALSPAMRKSLLLILSSVFLWYMGFNAVTTAFSKYVQEMWNGGVGDATTCILVANAGALAAYIPVGKLAAVYGRKKVIQVSVVVMALGFGALGFFHTFSWMVYILFGFVGIAWGGINVNSYPMVVELSRGSEVGKYTGYYYTFSMAAQILTPVLSGMLLENWGYWSLFPYSGLMVGIAFVTMTLTRHGDARPAKIKRGLEVFDV